VSGDCGFTPMAIAFMLTSDLPGSGVFYADTFAEAVEELHRRGRRLGSILRTRTGRWFVTPDPDPYAPRRGFLILVRDSLR
jgi:hypothetical protein